MLTGILLSLVVVSIESYLWSLWGNESKISEKTKTPASHREDAQRGRTGVALAMPLPHTESNTEHENDDKDEVKPQVEIESKDRIEDDGPETPKTEKDAGIDSTDNGDNEENNSAGTSKGIAGESDTFEGFKSVRKVRAKSFLVVFNGHSGSTAFVSELRAHSELENESFEPLDHGDYEFNTELALERAEELMDRGISKGKIPGFKVRPWHLHNKPEVWQEFVKKYDSRIIWQYRENIVKQAIGEYRHRYLNDSSVVQGLKTDQTPCVEDSDQKCRFKIDDMRFLHKQMNDGSRNDDRLAAATRVLRSDEVLAVRYEDYLYRRERTMKETFDFLGIDYQNTMPGRLKASPDSLCQMVINFQELCDNFHPCPLWRPYLDDDINDCRCKPGNWKKFDSTFCERAVWAKSG